jgi:hypothetical protein
MIARRGVGTLVVCTTIVAVAPARAQQRETCRQIPLPSTHTNTLQVNGQTQVYIGGGVRIECPRSRITLRADSAEQYPDKYYMVGHVNYEEPRLKLTSDFLTYYPGEERVFASGNVNASLPNGSTLVGPIAEYKRAIPRTRPRAQMTAPARPTITVAQKDSAGRPLPPMTLVAQTVFMDGDSLLYGGGQVRLSRTEVLASGDSIFIDTGRETMRIMREPRVESRRADPFTLTGVVIDAYSRARKLERVISRGNATATNKDMTLRADTIDLRVTGDLLERAYAWGKTTRAHATSTTQNVVADSLFVLMPQQRVRVIRAYRQAFAEAKPDSVRFRAEAPDTTDWIRGDSIIAQFDTLPPRDTTKTPPMRQLFAGGGASSLYHIASNDTSIHRAALNYVAARRITIDFVESRVSTVTARDSVAGVYQDPVADSTARRPGPAQRQPAKPVVPSIVPIPPRRP